MSEEAVINRLGRPRKGAITRSDGEPVEVSVPKYLLWPATIRFDQVASSFNVKIIDYGESFLPGDQPSTLHTPLGLRAPEVMFQDRYDHRVDLWSLGCLVSWNHYTAQVSAHLTFDI